MTGMTRRAVVVAALLALLVPLLAALPAEARPRYLDDVVLGSGVPGYDAQVVTTPRGVTLAVWASGSSSREVTFSTHRPGGGWIDAAPVADTHADLTAESPYLDVVMDSAGTVTIVWVREGGVGGIVVTSTWTEGGGWSAPLDLTLDGYFSHYVSLDVDRSGGVTAVWSQGSSLVTRSRARNGSWRAARTVPGSDVSQNAEVATDRTGRQVLTWLMWDGVVPDPDDRTVFASTRRDATRAWSSPMRLTASGIDAFSVDVVRTPTGVIALYRNGNNGRLEARTKPSGGSWSAPERVADDAVGVYADSDARDRVTVLVERADPDAQLVTRRYEGGRWTPREVIATDVDTFRSALDVSPAGRAGVQFRTTDGTVWTSNRTGNGWTDPHELGASGPGQIQADGVGVDDQGNLVALWNQQLFSDLTVSVLDAGLPTTRLTKLSFNRRTGKLQVGWKATDRWSTITAVSIELRYAKPGGGFSPWRSWPRPYTLASRKATATVAKDKRWCVHVRTTDSTGSHSAFVTRCTPKRR